MRRLVYYGALAAVVTAAGVTLAVLVASGSDDQTTPAAAQPPDNPGDTAPGRPTTTTEPRPDPERSVQQVEIKSRFGKACSDEGLCFEILPPQATAEVCDGNSQCVEAEPIRGNSPVVMRTSLTFDGEQLTGSEILACDLGPNVVLPQHGGVRPNEERNLYRFFTALSPGTGLLDLEDEGIPIISQFEVHTTSLSPIGFVLTDYIPLGIESLEGASDAARESELSRVFDLLESESPTFAELTEEWGKPPQLPGCTAADMFPAEQLAEMPPELVEQMGKQPPLELLEEIGR